MNDKDFIEELKRKRDEYGVTQTRLAVACGISREHYNRIEKEKLPLTVSAKYCYAAHVSRLHQNDRCKRFALCLVLTVRFRSLAPWGKLFQLFI